MKVYGPDAGGPGGGPGEHEADPEEPVGHVKHRHLGQGGWCIVRLWWCMVEKTLLLVLGATSTFPLLAAMAPMTVTRQ